MTNLTWTYPVHWIYPLLKHHLKERKEYYRHTVSFTLSKSFVVRFKVITKRLKLHAYVYKRMNNVFIIYSINTHVLSLPHLFGHIKT